MNNNLKHSNMIDTHCHLYSPEFDTDRKEVILRAAAQGVTSFYMPAIDSSTHAAMLEVERHYENCHAMIGLHPCSVKENFSEELAIVEQWLKKREFSAIGEAGLDFYWDKTFIKEQYIALDRQIGLALEYNLPLVLHTRNAMQETIDVIKTYAGKNLKGIFHCFGGSLDEAIQITDAGFYLGIGGVVTYKKSGLDAVLKHIDMKYLLLETDAPYLSPVPFRGKRNESAYLPQIAARIADIKQIGVEDVKRSTSENAGLLFNCRISKTAE